MRKKMTAILESNITANKKKMSPQKNRRDFLILATSALGAVGVGSFIYPLIKSMNPARDVLAAPTMTGACPSVSMGMIHLAASIRATLICRFIGTITPTSSPAL